MLIDWLTDTWMVSYLSEIAPSTLWRLFSLSRFRFVHHSEGGNHEYAKYSKNANQRLTFINASLVLGAEYFQEEAIDN